MWSLFRARDRFSLEELKHLNDQLHKFQVINDSNKDVVVESLRSIAELMIWGDQHDQQFFEFFMDNKVLAHFYRILQSDVSSSGGVAVQLLQTLNIMIQNFRSETAIYYMFSKEYINNIITFPFDFKDEELLAYYISFLRTISMKLDTTTVSCFIVQDENGVPSFPLYTEAIKFFHHEEGMVRIAVRTLTLNVYNVKHDDVRKFIMREGPVRYFEDLASFMRQQSFKLDNLVQEAATSFGAPSSVGRLEASIAELGDLLYYCNDVMNAGVQELSQVMAKHLHDTLVRPVLLDSLAAMDESKTASAVRLSPLTAMYLLSRLIHIASYKPLLDSIIADMLISAGRSAKPRTNKPAEPPDEGARRQAGPAESLPESRKGTDSAEGRKQGGGTEGSSEVGVGNLGERRDSGGGDPDSSEGWRWGSGSKGWWGNKATGDTPTNSGQQREDSDAIVLDLDPSASSWEMVLSYLLADNERWVMASLCVLVALLQNRGTDDSLLDALGILPRKRRHKQLLLQALVSSKSDEELQELLSMPPDQSEEDFEVRHGVSIEDLADLRQLRIGMGSDEGLPAVRRAAAGVRHTGESEDRCTCGAAGEARENGQQELPNGTPHKETCACGRRAQTRPALLSRRQVLDVLMVLLCRRPPPCAEAIWHVGWLLRQLSPSEHKVNTARLNVLNKAYSAAREDLAAELVDCWCDLLPLVIAEEWKVCTKALEAPSLQKDSSFVLMPGTLALLSEGDTSSAALGERMRTSVKVFVALHQMRSVLGGPSVQDVPPLGHAEPPPASGRTNRKGMELEAVNEGQELPLAAGDAMACRVAFERGKERSVLLMVASKGPAGHLLLAEALPRLGEGVVRVVAPLAGSRPTLDKRHNKWLHLRIRSPQLPSADAGTLGSSSPGGGKVRTKRLADGRWTLAFPDDRRAKDAQLAVLEELYIQSNAVRQILEPLLGPIEPFKLDKTKRETSPG